ncbi:MAG: YbaK/EbsC family protein [Clostridia bacterium]|nr:YbaK/EbsC family protein [Clostridia bacterium]MBR6040425.1 YbaK/EbsC family protein [Clostridia bacterium]
MSLERATNYLRKMGLADHIIIPEHSSATVAEAAEALGCEPGMIAKTLSFLQDDRPVLILAEGSARIDNAKYKARFSRKAKMIPSELVEQLIGHAVGGVCPFGVNEGVTVYLDESLKLHETVYPAAGTDHSAVRLTIAELMCACPDAEWVDVTRL